MFITVPLIISPAVTGATFPGSESAQITFIPSSFAASKSTPEDLKRINFRVNKKHALRHVTACGFAGTLKQKPGI